MVSHIIGNYLVSQKLITGEQLADILREQPRTRAKLGLIAVSEGLLTFEEAKAISDVTNSDRAFAEKVMEMEYMDEGQIKILLRKQGNAYMSFAQTLENFQLMNIEQLEQYLIDFQDNNDLTFADLEDLKSNDVNRILPMYFPYEASAFIDAACVAVRTLGRSVDSGIYPLNAYITDSFEATNGVIQFVEGEKEFSYAMLGKEKELAVVASRYMHEQIEEIDEDTLDIIGELINCVSGLYATALSQDGVIMDMLPPQYYLEMKEIQAKGMLVLPLVVKGKTFHLVINMKNRVKII